MSPFDVTPESLERYALEIELNLVKFNKSYENILNIINELKFYEDNRNQVEEYAFRILSGSDNIYNKAIKLMRASEILLASYKKIESVAKNAAKK